MTDHDDDDDDDGLWPEHTNDIDDWCPWSGRARDANDTRCPADCRDSDPDADLYEEEENE